MAVPWRFVEADERTVAELTQTLVLPEALARVLVARGMTDPPSAEKFLRKSMNDLLSPFELEGVSEAASRLAEAVRKNETILVHGDFDADGITATAVLTLFLRDLKAHVTPFVPNRLVEGHGISPRAVELAREKGATLFVTCDCGTSSKSEIEKLRWMGIETIVTDHHRSEETGLPALVVNPKRSSSRTMCDDLSGAGVAFMLVTALRARLREGGFFGERPEPNLKEVLDIVALGTIADMAPLVGQNRILVSKGLEQLTVSKRPGILAMRMSAGLSEALSIGAEDVGFRLAPRINAAARLGHADEALNLLLETDLGKAEEIAQRMEIWNIERKSLQAQMTRLASIDAERQLTAGEPVVFAASEEFHPGVIGLVAQKLAESYRIPSFVFAMEGERARGSARSRFGTDLMAAMESCRDLLISFGGHQEAGGCTIERKNLSEFQKRFRAATARQGIAATRELLIDASLNLGQLNERFLSSFNRLRPFGVGNPEPVFATKARVVGVPKEMGKDHVRVTLADEEGPTYGAVGFGMWRALGGVLKGDVEVAYTPEENEWNGRRELRIRLRSARRV